MPLIALDGLTKRYPGGVVALDGLTLDIEPGIVGLVGANGAGKSTLLKLLLGLIEPTSGTAIVMGLDVRHHGPAVRQTVGYMPEHDCLPPDASATDFVGHMARMSGLPRSAARERTAEVLRPVGPTKSGTARSAVIRRHRDDIGIRDRGRDRRDGVRLRVRWAEHLHLAGARPGLAYTLIWEGVLAGLLEGTRFLSIRQATLGIAHGLAGQPSEGVSLDPGLSVVIVTAAVLGAFVLGWIRLARFEIRGAD